VNGSGGALTMLAALAGAFSVPTATAGAETTPPPPGSFEAVLRDDTDALLLPTARPPPRPTVVAATRIKAPAHTVASVLLNPTAMREALPALVRADVVATRPGPRPEGWPDRLIAWEVEIPLFNLKGKGWLQQQPDAVQLTLVEGAFAPGHIRFFLAPAINSEWSVVTCEIQIDAQSSNWIFRRVARHDPWSETALSAATAWVLLRAVALRTEAAPGSPPGRPRDSIVAPRAEALDGKSLGAPALAWLRSTGTLATVRRAPGGRLAFVSIAVPVKGTAAWIGSTLGTPETWRAFPGWKSVTRIVSRAAAPTTPAAPLSIEVKDDIALLDLDAIWNVTTNPAVRATAVHGDIRGAVFGWDILRGDRADLSLAVLSMHPRLDAAGFIERKLVAAEPLLEHALALALTYVDAAAIADSFEHAQAHP
jgi:hypothetical protein